MTRMAETEQGLPTIVDAQVAVREFLEKSLPCVHQVNITKVARVDADNAAWEAEAEVWQPNRIIESLHLETQRPVLDQRHYLVRLDHLLNVLAYELEGSVRQDG
jgi:hypothetical protein